MKKSGIAFFILLINTSLFSQKKAVFVIVDGIPADIIEKLKTPALKAIAKTGGYTRAYVGGEKGGYSETPTISAVGYNSILTGTWVNKHNVWGNWDKDIAAPNYNYWNIFRLLKAHNASKKIAIFSSWLDNRTKLIGEGLRQAGNIKFDYHYDGLELDTISFPHDPDTKFMHLIDEAVVNNAAAYIKTHAPDLSWVYLEYTDDMGHQYGDGEQFYKAVEMMDDQVSRLWKAIQYRQKQFGEDWLIIITTDHGRDAETGKEHGGQSDRERGSWIVTNAKKLNAHFKKGASVVDIMPTIASFMNIPIPRERLMEVDGISLTGNISAIEPKANYQKGNIHIQWKALQKNGNAKIWLATTNNFKAGGKDKYRLAGEFSLASEKADIDVRDIPSTFYKIVIETPGNLMNRWIVPDKTK
ncbi:MAG: nucleotide pyrophosphatase [Chitinophagaceae bacterium]|nr:nucleotide pyrophosphatase [Chitinophagaceae bacterium]